MATPVWNKTKKHWVIDAVHNGTRKVFYSSVAGQKGKREVIDKYDEWIANGDPDKITVSQCVNLYLRDIEARLGKKDSYKKAERYTRLYVLPVLGDRKMNNISLREWQAILNEARPQNEDKDTLSHKTMTHLMSIINSLHRFAYNNYYCDEWRGTLYVPTGHPRGEKEILQPEQIRRLFEDDSEWFSPCFKVALLCGLRLGEALGLQEQDISDDGVLRIRRSINDDGEITEGKNKNARRTIPLPPLAEKIIRDTVIRNHSHNFGTDWIFPNSVGGQASQDNVRKQWNRLKKKLDLSGTPYSLRHTWLSIVSSQTHLAEGTIKSLIGHSSSMQTFDVYKHEVEGELSQAAQVIDLTFSRLVSEN